MTPRAVACLAFAVLLAPTLLAGCLEEGPRNGFAGGNGHHPPAGDSFRTLLGGHDGSYPEDEDDRAWYERDRFAVLEHASAWAVVAEKLPGGSPLPAVNWSSERVLLAYVAHGSPCDGYRITDVSFDREANRSVATVTHFDQVSGGCIAQVVYHYHAVAIPARETPVVFQHTTVPWYPTSEGNWTLSPDLASPWSPDDLAGGLLASRDVNVAADPATVQPDRPVVHVTVANTGDENLTVTGSDCGLHLAREDGIVWELFASAPGNRQEIARIVHPGESCETTVDLTEFHVGEDEGAWDPEGGTFRLTVAGGWGEGDRRHAVVAFGHVTVEGAGEA